MKIDHSNPKLVYDLGCGPGNVTAFLQHKWPNAEVIGVDLSPEMLEQANNKYPDNIWIRADLNDWVPNSPGDILYSNAVFQWIKNHEELLKRLLGYIRKGGVLAFQLPRNWNAPSHALIRDLVADSRHRDRLEPCFLKNPVASPEDYFTLLDPYVDAIDVWETEYLQVLEGENAVAEWTKGSALKPLLDVLEEDLAEEFYAEYSRHLRQLYPRRPDGKTLYPFRRLFVVAKC